MARHWYDLRVFTRDGEGGNPLAVIPDGVDVSTEAMQKAAAEIGYSEIVFLDWAEDTPCPRVRIFTPAAEMPFAGHPLVGTVWLLCNRGPRPVQGIEPPVGMVSCGAGETSAWIRAPMPEIERVGDGEWRARLGLFHRVVEMGSAQEVAAMAPVADEEVCVFALCGDRSVKVRFFGAPLGVPEDPATGSAAVSIAAVLHREGRLGEGERLEILQGDEVGRPSRIEVTPAEGTVRLEGLVTLDTVRHIKI